MMGAETVVVAVGLSALVSGYFIGNRRSHARSYNRGMMDALEVFDEDER